MASFVARRALRTSAAPSLLTRARRPFSSSSSRRAQAAPEGAEQKAQSQEQLQHETKQNPELYVLGGVMAAALAGAGFYFGRSPTTASSQSSVKVAEGGMPWETDASGKYKYHPGGNDKTDPKDAPSALSVGIIPDVALPKHLHDRFNKWGKDEYP